MKENKVEKYVKLYNIFVGQTQEKILDDSRGKEDSKKTEEDYYKKVICDYNNYIKKGSS